MADSITVTSAAPVSLTVTVSSAASTTITAPASSSLSVTNKGPKGDTGDQGPQGIQGLPGTDGADGQGVPTGGVERQVIVKQSGTDYDTAWEYVEAVYMQVKNDEGSALTSGTPLYVKGVQGSSILVGKACANNPATMPSTAILFEDLAIGATGEAIAAGLFNKTITGLTGVSIGDIVYVGNNGGLTVTKPTASNELVQNVGIVIQTNGSNIQRMKVSAIGRTNDIPNLASGKFFIGGTTGQVSAYTLPTADGTTGQLLQTDGAGAVTFVDFSGSPWTTSGSDIYYTTGNVGVGTTTPSEPLHVEGDLLVSGSTGTILQNRGKTGDKNDILITSTDAGYSAKSIHSSVRIGQDAGSSFIASNQKIIAIGTQSLQVSSSGGYTIAIGFRAAKYMNGQYNVTIGNFAGSQASSSTANSVFVGENSGRNTSNSNDHVIIGSAAGYYVTTGAANTLIGKDAGKGASGTSTFANTVAVGYQALTALTTGTGNTAVGYQADSLTTDGTNNTTVGYQATTNGTSVSDATAVGYDAIASNTSVAIGSSSRASSATGRSVAIGNLAEARTYDTVAIGYNSGPRASGNPSSSVFIGKNAGNSAGGNGLGQRVVIGSGACSTNGGGRYSVYIGDAAGRFGSQNNNSSNVMIGANAAYQHNSTTNSVGIGHNAMNGADTTGSVAVGWGANAGDADYNIMIGYQAGNNSMTGGNNTMIGYQSGLALTTSANTVALGHQALTALTTGTGNTAVGYQAGAALTTSSNNTVVGYQAGSLATGSDNTLLGYLAGEDLTSGNNNTALGAYALKNITTGSGNTSIGWGSGNNWSTTSSNVAVGMYAANANTGSNNVALGHESQRYNRGSDNISIGKDALFGTHTQSANNNVAIGTNTLRAVGTGADNNVGVGYASLAVTTGSNTVAVGYQALTALTTGIQNTAIGYQAGDSIAATSYNTLLGYQAGQGYASPTGLVAIGSSTGKGSSPYSVFVGHMAGTSVTGQDNSVMGFQAMSGTGQKRYNVAIGRLALAGTGSSDSNVAIGDNALDANGNKSYNVAIGHTSGSALTTGSSNVLIGYQSGSTLTTESNKLYIENSNSTTPLIYGEFDNDILRVNGSFEVTGGVTADDGGLTAAGDYGKGAEIWYQGASTPTAGSVYYLDSSGNWANTDASAVATAKGMIAVSAGTDSDVDGMLIKGFVYVGTDPGGSVGDVVYLSETANQLTTTAPTTASAVVRVCGYKVGTNIVYFDPSKDWIELS